MQNHLTLATKGYLYDAQGNRIAKGTLNSLTCDFTTNGFAQTSVYAPGPGGEQLEETDGSYNFLHGNIFLGGQVLATYSGSDSNWHYSLNDWLGSRRAQVNANGTFEGGFMTFPYGDGFTTTADPGATEHQFTGKERDQESGNDYFGARYYDSSMGRFISPDPTGLLYANPADPQSLNLYSYALNNPLINIDPTGTECVWDDGSYDSDGDSKTSAIAQGGTRAGCEGQGGTWIDHSYFIHNKMPDWSEKGNASLADMTVPSVTVTANLSATPTLQDANAFYQMWLSGVGPSTLTYGPNDGATKQLAQTPTAQGLRQKYIDAGCPGSANYPSGHVGPWLHGYGTLNATEMQVGGFNESMSASGGTTTFTITNTAGQASYSGATTSQTAAALNPFNSSGTADNPYGPNGLRHNINQAFLWTEPNPCGH